MCFRARNTDGRVPPNDTNGGRWVFVTIAALAALAAIIAVVIGILLATQHEHWLIVLLFFAIAALLTIASLVCCMSEPNDDVDDGAPLPPTYQSTNATAPASVAALGAAIVHRNGRKVRRA